jgi:hypothetical protein
MNPHTKEKLKENTRTDIFGVTQKEILQVYFNLFKW